MAARMEHSCHNAVCHPEPPKDGRRTSQVLASRTAARPGFNRGVLRPSFGGSERVKKSEPRTFQSRAKARLAILAPRSARGSEAARGVRPRRRPLQNLALPEHFVATASAAAKLRHVHFPRAKRGAKIVKRAFARDRRTDERDASPHFFTPSQDDRPAVGRNRGFCRAFDACSNAYAYLISDGSLHAPAKNERPTGRPKTIPAGTVMCG